MFISMPSYPGQQNHIETNSRVFKCHGYILQFLHFEHRTFSSSLTFCALSYFYHILSPQYIHVNSFSFFFVFQSIIPLSPVLSHLSPTKLISPLHSSINPIPVPPSSTHVVEAKRGREAAASSQGEWKKKLQELIPGDLSPLKEILCVKRKRYPLPHPSGSTPSPNF